MTKHPLARHIRSIPDFPKKGILFRDITTLLKEPKAFQKAVDHLAAPFLKKKISCVAAVEARGFILGGAVAHKLRCGFVPIRKPGKLPHKTHAETYDLEYGKDTLEIHKDAVRPGARVLVVDDLLATGGTARAAVRLLKRCRAKVAGVIFLIELADLRGRDKLQGYPVYSLIKY